MRTLSVVRACLVVAALNFWPFSATGAPVAPPQTAGDADSQKLITAAMEVDYLKMNFDAAKKKLSQAALNCRRKGCSTGLHASIHGYFAIIHWSGEDARELAIEDLKNMLKIDLEQTEDILKSTISKRKKKSLIVGFALETSDGIRNAREKLEAKDLDLVVLNNAGEPGAGFGVDTNRVTVIGRNGKQQDLELMSKSDLAEVLLDRVEEELSGR